MNDFEMIGRRFGRLVVISRDSDHVTKAGKKHKKFLCKCDCGESRSVLGVSLRAGRTLSCGCFHRDSSSARSLRHGHSGGAVMGKRSGTYSSWAQMRSRCNDPHANGYQNYGGRGIRVCERWDRFENFLLDMGERPHGCSIDRIDTNGNYEPSNCRWATREEQHANTRRSRFIAVGDERLTIKQWSVKTGLSYQCIRRRLVRGWSDERAVLA